MTTSCIYYWKSLLDAGIVGFDEPPEPNELRLVAQHVADAAGRCQSRSARWETPDRSRWSMVNDPSDSRGDKSATVDDIRLVERLRAGDEAAYEALVRLHGGRMLAVARRFVRDEDEAGDIVQEAFLSAFKSIDRYAGGSKLSTWLHRICVNAALMRLRGRRRRPERSIEDLLPKFLDDGHQADPAGPWNAVTDDTIDRRETRDLVRSKIDELPEAHRTVLLLRDIEELDTDETARVLDITPNAVKTRLHRARQALRTLLDPHFRGDGA